MVDEQWSQLRQWYMCMRGDVCQCTHMELCIQQVSHLTLEVDLTLEVLSGNAIM